MDFPPPPKRLAIPEMSPPSPAMLPKPPLNALATPPEAVCLSKLANTLLDCWLLVLLFDGDPNLMPLGTVLALNEEDLVSPRLGSFVLCELLGCAGLTILVGDSRVLAFCPFIFKRDSWPNRPDKLFFRLLTSFLHFPRVFERY